MMHVTVEPAHAGTALAPIRGAMSLADMVVRIREVQLSCISSNLLYG